jgi:hypothetical protein
MLQSSSEFFILFFTISDYQLEAGWILISKSNPRKYTYPISIYCKECSASSKFTDITNEAITIVLF